MNRLLTTLVLLGAIAALGETQLENKGITNLLQYDGTFNNDYDDGWCWFSWNPKEASGRNYDFIESYPPAWLAEEEIADSAYSGCNVSYYYSTVNGVWKCGNGTKYAIADRTCSSIKHGAGNTNADLPLTDIIKYIYNRGNDGGNCSRPVQLDENCEKYMQEEPNDSESTANICYNRYVKVSGNWKWYQVAIDKYESVTSSRKGNRITPYTGAFPNIDSNGMSINPDENGVYSWTYCTTEDGFESCRDFDNQTNICFTTDYCDAAQSAPEFFYRRQAPQDAYAVIYGHLHFPACGDDIIFYRFQGKYTMNGEPHTCMFRWCEFDGQVMVEYVGDLAGQMQLWDDEQIALA